MVIIGAIAAVLVVGAALAWATARVGVPGVSESVSTQAAQALPVGPVTARDVSAVRFDQSIRGYRMAQVDHALDVLAAQIAERDEEIARLRAEADPGAGTQVPGRGGAP